MPDCRLHALSIGWHMCSLICLDCHTSELELAILQGAERQRKKKLKSAAVVGVTCCSAGLPILEGKAFDVVMLDEASQMVEPLTLTPVTCAKPRSLTGHPPIHCVGPVLSCFALPFRVLFKMCSVVPTPERRCVQNIGMHAVDLQRYAQHAYLTAPIKYIARPA